MRISLNAASGCFVAMASTSRGLGSDPERLRRSHEVVVGIHDVDTGQLVAVPSRIRWMASRPTSRQNRASFLSRSRDARLSVRGSVRRVCKFKGEIEESDVANSKRIFFGSRPGYFLMIDRNVARPVEEPFAVKAYF